MVTSEGKNLSFLSKTSPQSTSQFILAFILESHEIDPRGRNLRSDMENELNIDISRSFEGSFAHQAGKTFDELPFNIKNIEQYEQFTTKCPAYYFDKAIALSCLKKYMYDFIQGFAPHLTPELVDKAVACRNKTELDQLFSHIELPVL